jgi:L-ascorbate metabolism protein UlaG (beta-lactamase superfamily)
VLSHEYKNSDSTGDCKNKPGFYKNPGLFLRLCLCANYNLSIMSTRFGTDLIEQMNTLSVPLNALAIWGMGQMGVALKGSGPEIIYIDLYLSGRLSSGVLDDTMESRFARTFPTPIEPSEITNAAYVLNSHEHGDHTDQYTLGPLAVASPQAQFVITGWSHHILDEAGIAAERRIVPTAMQPMQLGPMKITALPSAHYENEYDTTAGHRWLGFLIEMNGVTFYHTGDTVIYPGYIDMLRQQPQADVAMAAVNGRDAYRDSFNITGNLLPAEAAWLAQELGWDVLLGGHNDLFTWNTIAAGALADAIRQLNPRQKMHVLQPGELYLYVK